MSYNFPNVCFAIENKFIVNNAVLDRIFELVIYTGLNNHKYQLIAKELGFVLGISSYLETPDIGVWEITNSNNLINTISSNILNLNLVFESERNNSSTCGLLDILKLLDIDNLSVGGQYPWLYYRKQAMLRL